jgi:hypothetical protein
MMRNDFLRNCEIDKCCQLLDTCFAMVDWPSKKLMDFHQFLYFFLPCNFLKFQHFEQIIS